MKKLILGILSGWITLFILSYLLYGLLLPEILPITDPATNEMYRANPIFFSLIVGHLFYALIFTVIINDWVSVSNFKNGLSVGLILGLLLGLGVIFEFNGATYLYTSIGEILADVIIQAIRFGLAGGVIGFVMNKV